MSVFHENMLIGASGQVTGYSISRSLRFNSSDSAYLGATLSSPTDQDVFTFALWVKRAALGSTQQLFGVSTNHSFGFTSGDALNLTFGGSSALTTTALFRDPSAWYHIVWKQNANAHELYVNGVSVGTATATSNTFNTAVAHQICAANTTNYFNGYLADIHFIDGQALDPTSFGEFDATTGVWNPKAYTGSYGTNGFHLDFADNSAATATTLGKDTSGNGNNWTPNNLSVTAGAGNDSLVDVPTNGSQTDTGVGGEVRGNYATLNPLAGGDGVLSNGNLDDSHVLDHGWRVSTIGTKTGKWYAEFTLSSYSNTTYLGITPTPAGGTTSSTPQQYAYINNINIQFWTATGNVTINTPAAAITAGVVWKLALDCDAGKLWYGYDSIWYDASGGTTGNPATGANAVFTGLSASDTFFMYVGAYHASWACNFGQRPFAYTAPSGFKALCTANLPAPVVTKPSTVFGTVLYTGTGSALTPTSSLGFSPDLVWIKGRSGATDHAIYDAVRGTTKQLESNTTTDETTESTGLTAFNSNGFTVGALAQVNTSSATYAAWCWDESVSAGFDIVTYTGNGSARTISHSLGVAPSLIIVKARTTASTDQGWPVYHAANTAAPATDYLLLNSTAATADLDTVWNDTAPTSSVFSVGTNALVNANNDTYVAYLWAPVVGYSSFGSYTGNGSADGPFVYTGFRPRYIMIKSSSTNDGGNGNWVIYDTARSPYNTQIDRLYADTLDAETSLSGFALDVLSNGFKPRSGLANYSFNSSDVVYIYAAFAEAPFNYSRAR